MKLKFFAVEEQELITEQHLEAALARTHLQPPARTSTFTSLRLLTGVPRTPSLTVITISLYCHFSIYMMFFIKHLIQLS